MAASEIAATHSGSLGPSIYFTLVHEKELQ